MKEKIQSLLISVNSYIIDRQSSMLKRGKENNFTKEGLRQMLDDNFYGGDTFSGNDQDMHNYDLGALHAYKVVKLQLEEILKTKDEIIKA